MGRRIMARIFGLRSTAINYKERLKNQEGGVTEPTSMLKP